MPERQKYSGIFKLALVTCFIAASAVTGTFASVAFLTAPCPALVGAAPADLGATTVDIETGNGHSLAGWYVAKADSQGAVVLVHGIRSNRKSQIERMRLFESEGYAVLAIDLQAHGESQGERITFGYLESQDVISAVRWLKARHPKERIAVVGTSLGGASAMLAGPDLEADALVLEAVYGDIEAATANRLRRRLGAFGTLLTPVLVSAAEAWTGIDRTALRPSAAIRESVIPKLIVSGEADVMATTGEARTLFDNAREP
jgi:dienelactone hydrolase